MSAVPGWWRQVAFSGTCDAWLAALRTYLTGTGISWSSLYETIAGDQDDSPGCHLPGLLDCTELVKSGIISGTPYEFFLKSAKVALNEGREFGTGGKDLFD